MGHAAALLNEMYALGAQHAANARAQEPAKGLPATSYGHDDGFDFAEWDRDQPATLTPEQLRREL
jgi:hypothetical protein